MPRRPSIARVSLARAIHLAAPAVVAREAHRDVEGNAALGRSPAVDLVLGRRRLVDVSPAEADALEGYLRCRVGHGVRLAA